MRLPSRTEEENKAIVRDTHAALAKGDFEGLGCRQDRWVSWDNVAFLSQLGLMPDPGAGAGESQAPQSTK